MSLFGDNIRAIRQSRGYTQEQLAKILDSNQATLSAWERGDRMPTLENIRKIADVLMVPMSSLISVSEAGNNDDLVMEISDAIKNQPKLRVLFDKVRYLNQDDIRVLIRIAQAFANERIEFCEHV